MSAANVPQLVQAVVNHARKQHEDSEWDIVLSGMTYQDVADVVAKRSAHTPKGAIRAMRDHLDELRQAVSV
jgi:hypothetical protein